MLMDKERPPGKYNCWRCNREFDLAGPKTTMECCGLVYRYRIVGNVEYFDVAEKSNFLYNFSIPICVISLALTIAYIAYSADRPPGIVDFGLSTGVVAFEFWISYLFASEYVAKKSPKEIVPIRNNNIAKSLLLASLATVIWTCGIINHWFPASCTEQSECRESRYRSCP